jgi:endonuclease-3
MPTKTDWPAAIRPLLEKYKHTRHPLEYRNIYQLLVMVVLSAQSTDVAVNQLAPAFFETFPNMEALSKAKPEELFPYISKVRNFGHKASWLVGIAKQMAKEAAIPLEMDQLTALPGIGRKSANVIRREAGKAPEGVIVDIHVARVAPRLGIAKDPDPKKMEQQLMKKLPRDEWDAGMAMSFLGREICRPEPECERCLMNPVCVYYSRSKKTKQTLVEKPKKTGKEKVKKRSKTSAK